MAAVVEINYLKMLNPELFQQFKVHILDIACSNLQLLYRLIDQLAVKGIADCEFKANQLYVKGDVDKVAELFESLEGSLVSNYREEALNLHNLTESNIIRALFYKAFSRYAIKKNFKVFFKKGKKRLIPLGDLDSLEKEELLHKFGRNFAVIRGLYVMLDFLSNGKAILWVDLYSPIVEIDLEKSNLRLMSPYEAKRIGFLEKYTQYIPNSIERLNKLRILLKRLCEESETLRVKFADNEEAVFTCELYKTSLES